MVTAHKMALEADLVRADMVESSEFMHLANKYNVRAVPRIVINEKIQFDGALPEGEFLQKVIEASKVG